MINYSIAMRGNPSNQSEAKRAYAQAQYTEIMDLDTFTEHIASHGSVYKRADIYAVIIMMVDCMKEKLLEGQRINLGDLGVFAVSLESKGAASASEFTAANITDVNIVWTPGKKFSNLLEEAQFNLVTSRKAAAKVLSAVKAGETTVDLSDTSDSSDTSGE